MTKIGLKSQEPLRIGMDYQPTQVINNQWGMIGGNIENQTDLVEYIEQHADHSVEDNPALGKLLVTLNKGKENEAQYLVSREEYIAPAVPTFSPASGGSGNGSLVLTITCATSGATVQYKVGDGAWQTGTSVTLSQDTAQQSKSYTVSAKAVKNGIESEVATATYTVNRKVETPSISANGDQYSTNRTITMTCGTSGAAIHYTTDGSTPTESSPTYDPSNKPVLTATATVKAVAILSGWVSSIQASQPYTVGTKYTHAGLLLTGTASEVNIADLTQEKKATSPNGNYTFTTGASAMYIWFVIPSTQTIHDIANGAVPQAFSLLDTRDGYKFYRLDGQMGANQSITLTVS